MYVYEQENYLFDIFENILQKRLKNSSMDEQKGLILWVVLIGIGNYQSNSVLGLNFHLSDASFYDKNVTRGGSIYAGLNIHVIAEVGDYNYNS